MENEKKFDFIRGSLMILPYTPGVGVYTEDALIQLYQRLKKEGLFEIVFHEQPNMPLLQFMNFFSGPNTLLQILSTVKDNQVVDTVGMTWLTDLSTCSGLMQKAIASFVFFKDYQSPMYTDQLAKIVLEYWFDWLKLDIIIGMTPETNRAALLYAKRIGLKEIGRIPSFTTLSGEIVGGVVTYMTKDQYRDLEVGE